MSEFKDFVLTQLEKLTNLSCRRMFGGFGLYSGETFFAIIDEDRLFFRVDDLTVGEYEAEGMSYFQPSPRISTKKYYEVPPKVIESGSQLTTWARQSVEAAIRSPTKKTKKAKTTSKTKRKN
jgi:DNA transformation protein and related proteins